MNNTIIVCTHGLAGKELMSSVEMIMGPQENIVSIPFYSDESTEDIIDKYQKYINENTTNESFLILVDLFGGSPFNAAVSLALEIENIEVITGVNIPMILEVLSQRDGASSLDDLTKIAEESGKEGVQRLDLNIKQ